MTASVSHGGPRPVTVVRLAIILFTTDKFAVRVSTQWAGNDVLCSKMMMTFLFLFRLDLIFSYGLLVGL